MTNCKRYKVAAIDLGTVSSRLVLAQVEAGAIVESSKHTEITDLGEGVDATGRFCEAAVERVLAACRMFVDEARAFGAACICTTCTSAARDAGNSDELMAALASLGISPQVIPGEIEGALTFLGVAQDFPSTPILVADNGGGSTELALGRLEGRALDLRWVRSVDVGCRRMTDRFFSDDGPAGEGALAAAHAFAHDGFAAALETMPRDLAPERLVVCGGTATSLVAMAARLEPYDPAFVHLHGLSLAEIEKLERELAALPVGERGKLVGLQEQRAPVILGGAVAVSELLSAAGFPSAQASESDLLFGLSIACDAAAEDTISPVIWKPVLSRLAEEG